MTTNYRLILRDLLNEYYEQFKSQKKKNIWLSAFVPSEIIKCFDVDVFYPESYAAVLSVRNISPELFSRADKLGFNESICSYMRLFNGVFNFEGRLPFGKIPKPDALIATNNQCGTLLIMWELFSKKFNVPLFIIDFPADNGQKGIVNYTKNQLVSLIQFLELLTDTKLNLSKLKELVYNSSKVSILWNNMCDLVFQEKLEISIQTLTNNFFFPIVCAHSDHKTVLFLEQALNRLGKKREKDNLKKIYWWGYPLWFSNDKFPKLTQLNGKIIANNYLRWWCINLDLNGDLIKNIAKAYLDTYLNRNLQTKIEEFEKELKQYKIDGVIIHINSSCKRDSVIAHRFIEILREKNISAIEIEGDMCNKNKFQFKKSLLKIETLIEIL